MTIATTILATAHTLGQIRNAGRSQCAGMQEDRDSKGRLTFSQYRFSDQSQITIKGNKVIVGRWVMVEREVIAPAKRQCRAPDCWACSGTGLYDDNPCTLNDAVPF